MFIIAASICRDCSHRELYCTWYMHVRVYAREFECSRLSVCAHDSTMDLLTISTPPSYMYTPPLTHTHFRTHTRIHMCISAHSLDLQQRFLDSHNKFRVVVNNTELIWNDVLASTAAKWASECIYDHNHEDLIVTGHGQVTRFYPRRLHRPSSSPSYFPSFFLFPLCVFVFV